MIFLRFEHRKGTMMCYIVKCFMTKLICRRVLTMCTVALKGSVMKGWKKFTIALTVFCIDMDVPVRVGGLLDLLIIYLQLVESA